ncbi:LPS assembly lipoprotein LptE [Roseinatronobacter alkalisoli]|uniref:LPS assembly lipoprotein LptE n=1 Tax=Roseinatronobacter alkalisoli TaxID=3028235 RepID=A0ABT5TAY6_9RHOB|nr:LPS assembly lipoprotein LptE [Roseinatronobacter sp. HJB301]MDD7972109.1 LPS assembly lipoprotein LptE [Roseinatronobacter sp. HJB301]
MSLYKRRQVLGAGAMLPLLAACGFTPAYAPGGAGTALRGQVRAADPTDSLGFDFVAALEDRLGRPASPRFDLAYSVVTSERGSARVAGVGETRISVIGTVRYELTERATGDTVTSGSVRNFTNYSTTSTQLASLRAREDAERRLMRILADQVATRLIAAQAE